MAELNVQPKRRAPVWPWILLLIVIGALAYFLLRDKDVVSNNTDTDSTAINSTDTVIHSRTDTGAQYRSDTLRTDTTAR